MKHLCDRDRTWFCLLHWKYAHLDHVSKDFSCGVGIFLARSVLQRQPDNLFISHYHMQENQNSCKCCSWWGKSLDWVLDLFWCTCIPEAFHFCPLLHLLWCLFHCPILIQTFYCLPWAACSKLPFNGMETVVPSAFQMRRMSIQEL